MKEKYLQQYSGVWAMHMPAFDTGLNYVRSLDLAAHIEAQAGESMDTRGGYLMSDGVAVIELVGTITKYGSSLVDGPSIVRSRRALANAINDAQVQAIVLLIDSPGGSVAGVDDLAADIFAARAKKPIIAYIEDLGASAAYYLASQAQMIYANIAGLVGSIGVYGVIEDSSEAAKMAGFKVHVVKSGALKGAGVPGTVVTDEQLSEAQRIVDAFHSLFVSAVARGRGIKEDAVAALADGRIYMATEAKKLGLIDDIDTFASVLERVAGTSDKDTQLRGQTMPDPKADEKIEPVAPAQCNPDDDEDEEKKVDKSTNKAATVAELRTALPNADADYILRCAQGGLTVEQAQALFVPVAATKPGGPGMPAKTRQPRPGEDADYSTARAIRAERNEHPFMAAARALAAEEGITLVAAQSRVAADDPDLYSEYRETFRVSAQQAKAASARRTG